MTLLERARTAVGKGVDMMDACVERVSKMLDEDHAAGKYDSKLGSHLAYLVEHVSRAMGELRKLEKHDADAVKKMSPEERDALVMAYAIDLPRDRWEDFKARVDAEHAKDGIL
jgi:hypothetical protein